MLGICKPDRPLEEMPAEERNGRVHAVMVSLMQDKWTEVKKITDKVWAPVERMLRESDATPGVKQQVLREFWKGVRKFGLPEDELVSLADVTPKEAGGFFKQFAKFYDPKTETIDEVALLRYIDKNRKFRSWYHHYRKVAYSYLETLRQETPEGTSVSPLSVAARMKGIDHEIPIPESVGTPVNPGGLYQRLGEMLGAKEPASKSALKAFHESLTGTPIAKMLPTKGAVRRIAQKFGGVYSKIWEEGEKRRQLYDRSIHQKYQEIQKVLGPYLGNVQVRQRLSYIVEKAHLNPEHPQYEYMQKFRPTAEELEVAGQIRGLFDRWGKEFEVPSQIWLENYLPKVREHGSYLGFAKENALLNRFFVHERIGDLNPRETDVLEILKSYVRIGEKYKVYDSDGWLTHAREAVGALKPHKYEHTIMTNYLADIVESTSERLAFHLQGVESFAQAVAKVIGADPKDTRQIGALYLRTIYSGALGLRVVPLFKQVFQTLLLGGSFYGKYLARGIKAASRGEAWEYVRKLHIPVEHLGTLDLGAEVQEALSKLPGRIAQKYADILQHTTKAYMKADTLNRVIGFFSGKSMFEDATRAFWEGKIDRVTWEKRVRYQWFDGFEDLQRDMSRALDHRGDTKLLSSVGDRYATHTVEDLNWVYRRGNSPLYAREHPYILQFGTWPANFGDLLARHIEYIRKTHDPSMLVRGAAIMGGTYAVGKGTGLDFRSLYATPSLMYTMGPTPEIAIDASGVLKAWYYGSPLVGVQTKELLRDIPVFLPVGLAAWQFASGVDKGDLLQAFGVHHIVDFDFEGVR